MLEDHTQHEHKPRLPTLDGFLQHNMIATHKSNDSLSRRRPSNVLMFHQLHFNWTNLR